MHHSTHMLTFLTTYTSECKRFCYTCQFQMDLWSYGRRLKWTFSPEENSSVLMRLTAVVQQRLNEAEHWLASVAVSRQLPSLHWQHQQLRLAGWRLRRAGGGGAGRDQCLPAFSHPSSGHLPLQDAGILPANGKKVGVIVGEADVGYVTPVALVLVTWCLGKGSDNEERLPTKP